jgi:hypothetical protein
MSEEGKIHLHDVAMLTLGIPILLMGVWTRHEMGDAIGPKIGVETLIFTTLIGLNDNDLSLKQPFHKLLKFKEIFRHLGFMAKQINPCKLAIIINETHIILLIANRVYSRTPHIEKNKLQQSKGAT